MDMSTNPRAVLGANNPPLGERLASDYEELSNRAADILTAARELPVEITSDEENDQLVASVKALRALQGDANDKREAEVKPHLTAQRETNAFFKSITDRLQKGRDVLEARGKKFLDRKAAEERTRREEAARIAREDADRLEREARAAEEASRVVHAEIVLDQAVAAEKRAELAEEAAQDSNAEMARTRTSSGLATLNTVWTFEVRDISKVPLEQLRAFISADVIDKAVRAFVKNGGRQLPGVHIFEGTKASYR